MSDEDSFDIRYSNKFESTYKGIFRTHYRQNTTAGDEFEEFFDALEEALAIDPCVQGSVSVSWPGNFGCPGWNLRKFKLPMPGLRGASARGRLLYILNRQAREIYLLWIYTHQEFIKQPPTTDLKKAVKDLVRHLDD